MANATKITAAILIQVSVALVFFLAVSMARNIVNHELTSDLIKPRKQTFPGFLMPATPPTAEPVGPEPNTSRCSKTYKVKKGETCYSTWTQFKMEEKTFYALNSGIDCDNLYIGQALCISGGGN